jgi:transcriptional regulator with XRE-family HTH domain
LIYFSINIHRLRAAKGMSQTALAAALDVARTTISNWEKGVSFPLFEDLIKLANTLGTSLDDLVKSPDTSVDVGDRQGLIANPIVRSVQKVRPEVRPDPSTPTGSVRFERYTPAVVTVGEDGEPNIVMLDAQAAAGLPANYANPEYFRGKPAFRMPGYRYRNGTIIAIQVIGDSMEPTIGHEDWLIATHLEDPLAMMREGYVHVVVAQDGVVAKRLYKAPGGTSLLCHSDNEVYRPYELPLAEALQVYKVLAVISEDLSNSGADIRERLTRLERDMLALQARSKKG